MSIACVIPSKTEGSMHCAPSGPTFMQTIGWKEETELVDFVHIVSTVLLSHASPLNGWTWYKFEKEVYNTVRCMSHETVRSETEYKRVWERLRKCYAVRIVLSVAFDELRSLDIQKNRGRTLGC